MTVVVSHRWAAKLGHTFLNFPLRRIKVKTKIAQQVLAKQAQHKGVSHNVLPTATDYSSEKLKANQNWLFSPSSEQHKGMWSGDL